MHNVPKPEGRGGNVSPAQPHDDATAVQASPLPRATAVHGRTSRGHVERSPRETAPRPTVGSEDDPSEPPTAVTARRVTGAPRPPFTPCGPGSAPGRKTRATIGFSAASERPSTSCATEPTTWIEEEPATNVQRRARQVPETVRIDVAGLGDAATVRAVQLPAVPAPRPATSTAPSPITEALPVVDPTDRMRALLLPTTSPTRAMPPAALWGVAVVLGVTAAVVAEIALVLAR